MDGSVPFLRTNRAFRIELNAEIIRQGNISLTDRAIRTRLYECAVAAAGFARLQTLVKCESRGRLKMKYQIMGCLCAGLALVLFTTGADAAGVFGDESAERHAERKLIVAGFLDLPADGIDLGASRLLGADRFEPLHALLKDERTHSQAHDVIDHGRAGRGESGEGREGEKW